MTLTPLFVNLWGDQPFELAKVAVARTLIWLLGALALAGALAGPRRSRRILHLNPLENPLAPSLALLALVLVASTVTAQDWRLSLWGSYERGQGTVTLLSYLLLCALAASQLGTTARARAVVTAMAATSAPIILIGIAQALGWNPYGLVTNARSPIYATLGRANFVGAYLAMLTPLTLALAYGAGSHRTRPGRTRPDQSDVPPGELSLAPTDAPRIRRGWIHPARLHLGWYVLLAGQLVTIGLTYARGAWIAAFTALAIFGLLLWWPRMTRARRIASCAVAAALMLSGPLAVLTLGRHSLGSIAARAAIWRASAGLVVRRPLLGYGADALGLVFGRVYPPHLVYLQGRDVFVDRAHNLLLDWALIAGVAGLLAYLLVLAVFAFIAGRPVLTQAGSSLDQERRILLAAILAAVFGNVANLLVSFDVTPTAAAMWLLMGVGVGLASPRPIRTDVRIGGRPLAASVALLSLTFLVALQFNARPLLADVAAHATHINLQRGEWAQAVGHAQRAVALWPAEPSHHLLLADTLTKLAGVETETSRELRARAEATFAEARRLRPGDAWVWLKSADFYASTVLPGDPVAATQAEDAYLRARALAPNDARIYAALGSLYLQQGDPARAAHYLRQAVALDATLAVAFMHLGDAELALGRVDAAMADYREAKRLLAEESE